jgi:predicted nucleotidyltransferase
VSLKEIRTLNKMLVALVDLLEEKGILTHEEWDKKVEQEIEETKGLKKLD